MLPFYRKLIDYLMNYKYHNSSYLEKQTLGIIGNFAIALCISIVIYYSTYIFFIWRSGLYFLFFKGLNFFVTSDNK